MKDCFWSQILTNAITPEEAIDHTQKCHSSALSRVNFRNFVVCVILLCIITVSELQSLFYMSVLYFIFCLIIPMFALFCFIKVLAADTVCIVDIYFLSYFALPILYVIYLVWLLPDNIFALPTRTTLSFTETLWPSGSFHLYSCNECFYPSSSAIQELFADILCYIIGWYPLSLFKNLNNFEKALHFKATICVHASSVVNVLLLLTTSSKVVKDLTEVCIWSYFMEECRPTNYNIWLPTCYSLRKRGKKNYL